MLIFSFFKQVSSFLFPIDDQSYRNNRGVIEFLRKKTVLCSKVSIFKYNQNTNKFDEINSNYKVLMKIYESETSHIQSLYNHPSSLINTTEGPEGAANFFFTAPDDKYYEFRFSLIPLKNQQVENNLYLSIKNFPGTQGNSQIVSYPDTVLRYVQDEIKEAINKSEDIVNLFKNNQNSDAEIDRNIKIINSVIIITIILKLFVIIVSFYYSNKRSNKFFEEILKGKK